MSGVHHQHRSATSMHLSGHATGIAPNATRSCILSVNVGRAPLPRALLRSQLGKHLSQVTQSKEVSFSFSTAFRHAASTAGNASKNTGTHAQAHTRTQRDSALPLPASSQFQPHERQRESRGSARVERDVAANFNWTYHE